ncbi:MAG: protein-tyrosine phosphatase [Rhodobacteraceae bacterium HLUCCA24]|nr:MAG: protein-tyrosine phosphatase [Rhodobacteraceae bacterium HLUCCA24]
MTERRLPFEGAVNFRDLGGYPVAGGGHTAWRRVYRSDSLAELTDSDLARLEALGLYGVVDLRLTEERAKKPDRLPDGHGLKILEQGFLPRGTLHMLRAVAEGHLPPDEIRAEVLRHYRLFPQEHLPDYAATFRLLIEAEGRPVVIHCTSGKDRTGFGAALLLRAAGVEERAIAEDYALTNTYRRDIRFMFGPDVRPEALEMLTAAHPEYIRTALDELARLHPDTESWLEAMGLDAAERRAALGLLREGL